MIDATLRLQVHGHRDQFQPPDDIEESRTTPLQRSSLSSSVSVCGAGSSWLASTGGGEESVSADAQPLTEDGASPADVAPGGVAETPFVVEREVGGASSAVAKDSPAGEETGGSCA